MDAPAITSAEPTPAPSNRSVGFSFSTYLLGFALAVVLYALSPGPVVKCFLPLPITGPLPRAFEITFAPLGCCYNRFPAVHRFYDWYFKDVWGLP